MDNNSRRDDWEEKDVRKIHQLQIIGIIEADFNIALKILFVETLWHRQRRTASTMINVVHDRTAPLLTQPYKK